MHHVEKYVTDNKRWGQKFRQIECNGARDHFVEQRFLENFSKKEQQWLEKLLKKIAAEATHLANDASEKFIKQISLGSKNENKKDKKSKELKVANPREKTNFQTNENKMQRSTLQKLMYKFSRK